MPIVQAETPNVYSDTRPGLHDPATQFLFASVKLNLKRKDRTQLRRGRTKMELTAFLYFEKVDFLQQSSCNCLFELLQNKIRASLDEAPLVFLQGFIELLEITRPHCLSREEGSNRVN